MKKFLLMTFFAFSIQYSVSALAQITYTETIVSKGFYGQGAFNTETKTFIDGDKKATESQFKFTGSLMKHFSPKGTDIEITRLDKELFWKFTEKDKAYKELTFKDMRKMFEEGETDTDWPDTGEDAQEDPEKNDNSEYEWQEPTVKVVDTGEVKKINSFDCRRYIILVETVGKHKTTGIMDTVLYKNDTWNTENMTQTLEKIQEFDYKLAEKLGFDRQGNRAMARVMSMYQDQLQMLNDEMKKVKGYSIKTEMSITQTVHARQKDSKVPEMSEEEEDSGFDLSNPKSALGGLFGKKAKKMVSKKVVKEKSDTNRLEIFQAAMELKDIQEENIDPLKFEVPERYKKISN